MTQLLYHADSYLESFDAIVTGVDENNNGLVLNRTIFFPGGGGQPSDSGTFTYNNSVLKVKRSKRIKGKIVHLIEDDVSLPKKGDDISGQIDWQRRYCLMRTHTAMHILCGVIFRDYGASVTGGNMKPLRGRMDFEFETMRKQLVDKIEQSVNQEVSNALPISVKVLPRERAFQIPDLIRTKINLLPKSIQNVRVVEIVGLDIQADGGTHLKNTSEVGNIRIVDYKSKGKINKRIYVEIEDKE